MPRARSAQHLPLHPKVSIIQGSTGSGKTTQVPQYILDFEAGDRTLPLANLKAASNADKDGGGPKTIVVTQPRRLAAMTASVPQSLPVDAACP